ncbi:MAG: homoserine dehydrogenase [Qipengyuania sp.]|nr:homoserine dehydrogenase [Qipengyuania sp.]
MSDTAPAPPATPPLRIALAGLGTVGVGVLRLIETNRAIVEARAGRPIEVVAVSAREAGRQRGIDLAASDFVSDLTALARRGDVDVVIEAVGGAEGAALALAEAALGAGKGLITANKAMIAHHGLRLAQLAEAHGAPLAFEAAVAGGIPVVKGLREGAAANAIERITGILNGTSNYILSTMEATGADFAEVLAEAQAKGYAEADPSFDIDGIDAAHKLAILAAIGFGARIDFAAVSTSGIREVRAADIAQARVLGFVIRLVGVADCREGKLLQRVRPCLVPTSHPLAHVTGATNAVVAEGNFSGRLLFQGAGAGAGPTASAIVADLIDIARGTAGAPFSLPAGALAPMARADPGHRVGRDYIRFTVADRTGVLAEITAAMRDAGVSIESLIQHGRASEDGGEVLVAMVTHEGPERCVTRALELLEGSASLTAAPLVLPILRD